MRTRDHIEEDSGYHYDDTFGKCFSDISLPPDPCIENPNTEGWDSPREDPCKKDPNTEGRESPAPPAPPIDTDDTGDGDTDTGDTDTDDNNDGG